MMRIRHAGLAAALLVLGACAAEVPEEEELPLPPPPPPARLQAARHAGQPSARGPAEGEGTPNGAASAAETEAPSPGAVAQAAPLPAPRVWHVLRDGTTGCAEAAPLRLARQGGEVVPRLLAEARAAGGCRTTFRINEWVLEAAEGDLVRLRLLNGQALTLWFVRSDVVAPP
ncbi:hypothetical protein [Neoroseomonas soli]|uniref:Alkaline proteinase inhibitor/ Outer membrane lipoprotein Omp19 domain-containing protein n=1 Tax=Neoroseomonas soli TaxID=1081025 RepID=A0A9X9X3X6_9PROT|nr:hypothetical protein [Neoroseomonas soli]MBR0674105.1 hypothetical protein [Neoroseomonas soli]